MATIMSFNIHRRRTSLVWFILLRVPEAILGVLIAILVVSLTVSVVARYVFALGLTWSDEAARLLFVWIVFVGFAVSLNHRANIGVDLLVNRLPPLGQRFVTLFQDAVILAFSMVFTWESVIAVKFSFMQRLPGLQISIAWLYFAVLVAGILMTIYAIANLWETVRGRTTHIDGLGANAQMHSE